VTAIIRQVEQWRSSGMLGQLIRFGIAGAISSAIYSAVYLPLANHVFARGQAVFAVPFAFAVAVTVGFFLHSAWSFKGHGTRDQSGRQHMKFVAVQGFGLLLNLAFTWIITGPLLHGPNWLPLIPAFTVIPVATFALNRQWVFG
jgi:putative flippase GtrA